MLTEATSTAVALQSHAEVIGPHLPRTPGQGAHESARPKGRCRELQWCAVWHLPSPYSASPLPCHGGHRHDRAGRALLPVLSLPPLALASHAAESMCGELALYR